MATRHQCECFFREADADNSGSLTVDELVNAVRKKQPHRSEADLRRQFRSVDTSGDGLITIEEFMTAMGFIPLKKEAMMCSVFNEFDANGDGSITRDELKQAFEKMKKDFTECEYDAMMKMMDTSGDGKVDYKEFITKVFHQ